MAALLLMVAWNTSEAHKVVGCCVMHRKMTSLSCCCAPPTVLFDMVIAISVGIVLGIAAVYASYRTHDWPGTLVVDVPDDVLVLRVIGPLFFAAAEGLFTDL
ncbi:hypothetical protein ACNKHP_01840 [Shigella boydii]